MTRYWLLVFSYWFRTSKKAAMNIHDEKTLLRTRISERAARLSGAERDAESRSICRRALQNLPEGHLTICAYMPMPSEADIRPLLEELLQKGHSLFLPRFTRVHFEFRRVQTLEELIPGKFKLPEPPVSAELLITTEVSVALLPGIAFDRSGHRLGRGNGGYDRWLQDLRKNNPTAKVWGIALDHQITDSVPMESHDQTVDALITPREMIIPTA